jgi:hypothetical protein
VRLVDGFSRPTRDAIQFLQLPGTPDDYKGVSYVFACEPDADLMLARLGGHRVPESSKPFGDTPCRTRTAG